jgi:hypothetical protein
MTANISEEANPQSTSTLQLVPTVAPLLFSGPPHNLTGEISLVNPGQEKEKLRSVGVRSASLKGAASLPLDEMPFFAKLYPGQQARVSGTMVVHHATPPGSYPFELTLGNQTLAAIANVEEVIDLRLQPGQITLLAGGPGPYTRTFIAENKGNVDLATGAQCEAPIFDSYDIPTALLIGLHEADKSSIQTMVKEVLLKWSEIQAGMLITKRDSIILHAGQKKMVDLSFELPHGLKPLRHYRSSLQLYNASLFVDIYTTVKYSVSAKHAEVTVRKVPARR